jgi:MarR family transcriptional regulator, 2-MHQ and catechol-resistance regulon repressor
VSASGLALARTLDNMYLDAKIYRVTRRANQTRAPDVTAPPSDASGTHLWLVLFKAYRVLQRHAMNSIEAESMGQSDFATLELLLHKGPQPVNEIGRRIHLTSGSITTAVDRLQRRGLVTRGEDAEDRRARVVRLTPRGKSLIAKVFVKHKAAMDAAADGLSREERAVLVALLRKLGLSAEDRLNEETRDV